MKTLILVNFLFLLFPLEKRVNGQRDHAPCQFFALIAVDDSIGLSPADFQVKKFLLSLN